MKSVILLFYPFAAQQLLYPAGFFLPMDRIISYPPILEKKKSQLNQGGKKYCGGISWYYGLKADAVKHGKIVIDSFWD